MISSESIELVEHYLSGSLTPDMADRLYADLRQSDDLQRYLESQSFVEYTLRTASALDDLEEVELSGPTFPEEINAKTLLFNRLIQLEKNAPALIDSEKSATSNHPAKIVKPLTPYQPVTRKQFVGIGTLLMLIVSLVMIAGYFEFRPSSVTFQDSFQAVARIVQCINAEWEVDEEATWENASETYKTGQELEPGRLKLKNGVVKLEFADGAEAILEGPTEFLVKGKGAAFCPRGHVSIYVPPRAVGFEVSTPFGTVIDLGTKFSVQVSETNEEVHVLKGKVDFKPTNKDRFSLLEGSAAMLGLSGETQKKPANPETFFSEAKFVELRSAYDQKRKIIGDEQEQRLEKDPNLIFQLKPKQTGLTKEQGSRPDKTAVRLRTSRDRYRFQIDRIQSPSLTLLACVRLEDMRNISNMLLIGDSHYDIPGVFLWQLNRNGTLQFHVNDGQSFQRYDSSPIFQRKDCKTWVVLGLVADAENRTITHYFDGRAVSAIPWDQPQPLRLDAMTLGNEHTHSERNVARFFNGAIEDFWIFDRPFTPEEIKSCYWQSGNISN